MPNKQYDTITLLEKRVERQNALIQLCRTPIVTLTLNIPTDLAKMNYCQVIFHSALEAFDRKMEQMNVRIIERHFSCENTGQEGLFAVDVKSSTLLKKAMIEIENSHQLGQLFNFDVMSEAGKTVSRKSAFLPARTCLLCQEPALKCSSRNKHKPQEIEKVILRLCGAKVAY
jgi:holo-ACP synthase